MEISDMNSTGNLNNVTNGTIGEVPLYRAHEISRMIDIVTLPIIFFFGIFGNILAFYVLTRGSLKRVSTCFYMRMLALADTSILLFGASSAWLMTVTEYRVNPFLLLDCKPVNFILNFSGHYSSLCLVIMSIEKLFVIYFPLKARNVCTVKTARWASLALGVALFVYHFQVFFWTKEVVNGVQYCKYSTVFLDLDTWEKVDAAFYSFGPFAVMFTANVAIVLKLMMAKIKSSQSGTESTNQALSKSAVKGTTMVVTVSLAFIILTGPVAIWRYITFSNVTLYSIGRTIVVKLRFVNHGINAVLYCISGSRFRKEVLDTLCCRRGKSLSRTSLGSSVVMTNVSASVSHML